MCFKCGSPEKVLKHERLLVWASTKRDGVNFIVSKAMNDQNLANDEFKIIMKEITQYRLLKEEFRAKIAKQQYPNAVI